MKVILVSGHAQNGKDQFAQFVDQYLKGEGKSGMIIHYADYLKYFLKQYLGWDGVKDEHGRMMLQYWGTDVIRAHHPDAWVNIVANILKGLELRLDYAIIPDCRFPNESEVMRSWGFDTITVRVERPNFDNGLSEAQKNHSSETSMDHYEFDEYVINDKGLPEYAGKAAEFAKKYIK